MAFRTILAPTDFGPASERALETAAALATCFGARLVVLHVVEENARAYPFPMPREVLDAAKAHLTDTVASLHRRMLDASSVLRDGVAWEEICAYAAETPADLVVLGSQGRRGLPRMVLGSVAERVVRMATVPVLTVHPSDHVAILAGGMDRFRHVLAPTDFSEASRRGVDTATELAARLDAALTVVHVQPQPSFPHHVPPDVLAAADAQAHGLLEELLGRVRARCPKAEGVLKRGTPWECVLDVAKDRGADLVVLSTHGRRGLPRVFMGSVAEKIVRLAHVPVVTVGPA